jgi:hypothetical protein
MNYLIYVYVLSHPPTPRDCAGTLGQKKRYMHINIHTLTRIYMRGVMRENIYMYIYLFVYALLGP